MPLIKQLQLSSMNFGILFTLISYVIFDLLFISIFTNCTNRNPALHTLPPYNFFYLRRHPIYISFAVIHFIILTMIVQTISKNEHDHHQYLFQLYLFHNAWIFLHKFEPKLYQLNHQKLLFYTYTLPGTHNI